MRPALSLPWSFWSRRLRPRAASSRFLHRCFELSPRTGRLLLKCVLICSYAV
jgi:hypothetical protein